jgi:hypothetical protein
MALRRRYSITALIGLLALFMPGNSAEAFTHIAQRDESLAALAERYYGDSKRETVLAVANGLDAYGGSVIVPGMRLEIPAPSYVLALPGDTWPELARIWLGSTERAAWLARANGQKAWVPPSAGLEVRIPAVVTHMASEGETIHAIHKKFAADIEHAWELNGYNGREGVDVKSGDVILIPLLELALSDRGREAARISSRAALGDRGDVAFDKQRDVDHALPLVFADLRAGRYLEVIRRAGPFAEGATMSRVQAAQLYRALLEAYVAVDATGAAADACERWMKVTTETALDPRALSPKIMRVCARAKE